MRCRKLKKKCNKAKPECSNCDKAGEKCQYVPRKQRVTKKDKLKLKLEGPTTPHDILNPSSPSVPHHAIEHLSPAILDSLSYLTQQLDQMQTQPARLFHPQLHTNYSVPYANIEHNHSDLRSMTPANGQQHHHQQPEEQLQREVPSQDLNNEHGPQSFSTISTPPTTLNPIDARAPSFDAYPKQISKVLYGAVGIKTNSNVSIIPPIIDKVLLTRIMNAFFMHTYRICPVINKTNFSSSLIKCLKMTVTVCRWKSLKTNMNCIWCWQLVVRIWKDRVSSAGEAHFGILCLYGVSKCTQ